MYSAWGGGKENTRAVSRQACASVTPKPASPREVQAFLICWCNKDDSYMVMKAKGKIPQEDVGVYAFCPLSKRGKAEHTICRGINKLHGRPRTPWAIPSTRGGWTPLGGCTRRLTTPGLAWRHRKAGRHPGRCYSTSSSQPGCPDSFLAGLPIRWPASRYDGLQKCEPCTFFLLSKLLKLFTSQIAPD